MKLTRSKSTKPTILTWQKQNTFNTRVLRFKFWTYDYLIPSSPLFIILTSYYGFFNGSSHYCWTSYEVVFPKLFKTAPPNISLITSRCMGKEPALKSYTGPEREVENEPTLNCSVTWPTLACILRCSAFLQNCLVRRSPNSWSFSLHMISCTIL